MFTPELETERLILRRFNSSDINLFHELISDKKINEFNYYPDTSIEYASKYVNNIINNIDNNPYESWVIEIKDTHIPIGKINVNNIYSRFNYCNVGYTLKYDYWGNGYAAEALVKVTDHLLNDIKYHLVECSIDDRNVRSIRVVEKAGFIKDGYINGRRPNGDGTYSGISYYSKSL